VKVSAMAEAVHQQYPKLSEALILSFGDDDYARFAEAAGVRPPSPDTVGALEQRLIEDVQAGSPRPQRMVTEDGQRPRSAAEALVGGGASRRAVVTSPVPPPPAPTGNILVKGRFIDTVTRTYQALVPLGATYGETMEALLATEPLDEQRTLTGEVDTPSE